MKVFNFFSFGLILFISINSLLYSQELLNNDTAKIPVQYRREVEVPTGCQSYEEKYAGKNLEDEKRRLYPLDRVTSGTGVWTELNPKVPRVDYLGIHFVNIDTGWACGDLGTIIKTTDGGTSWTTEETNTTTPILKVNSFNGQIVIASGFNGLILRSTDGGDSFTQMTSGVTGDLWGLQMINDTLGWACGKTNSLIKTTDAGLTWTRIYTSGYTSDYWWIDFLNENYGFIAANGKVIKTIDGGISWEIIQAGDNQALYSVDVIDSLHIAAAGYGGTGYRGKTVYSSDGGSSWVTGGPTTFDPINCIKYVDPDTGYFVMSEVGLWKTTNSGQNWIRLDSIPLTNIGEFEIQLFSDENVGYDVGSSLKIYKTDGNLDIWHKLIINDDFADVFFPTEQKGFVISSGPQGRVYRTFDSGNHWQLASGPSGYSLFFTDSLTGFLGSTSVWKTTNGGNNWYQTNSLNIYGGISKIFFINNQSGWYVTFGGVIFNTTDSGENWTLQLNVYPDEVTSIRFIDSINGWACSRYLWQTTNSGNNWVQRDDIPILFSKDVNFINIDTGWVAGYSASPFYNAFHKTTDGGLNWSIISEIIGPNNFNYFPDPVHWIINGSQHRYITENSGSDWIEITTDVPSGFNRFQAPSDLLGYAAGNNGLILKYDDTTYTPVELVSFFANKNQKNIFLKWTTVTETNNEGFEIQRFAFSSQESSWERIGFVRGNGTTTLRHTYSFIDQENLSGKYKYRLKQIDFDGSYKYSIEAEVEIAPPNNFTLEQNYPNPFNPETNISFTIPQETNVSIKLYDITGREIKVLVNEKKQPGYYTIKLKGGDLSSGVYFCRLVTTSGFTAVKKLILLK